MKPFALASLMVLASSVMHADDRFAGLDAYVAAAMARWEVPGLAMAVVKDGHVVLARGYGVREIGTGRGVTPDTVFTIASCTKSFTAAGVAILADEGKLRWDDPVRKHLPDFELGDPYLTEHVTLRDLLCHRTGLQRCDLLGDRADYGPAEILRRTRYIPLTAELRTKFTYSNPMYSVLSEVVARVSGRPWEEFVDERIFKPLNMTSTTPAVADVPPEQLAPRHWQSDAGIVARPVPRAGGGFYSTVADMAQWLQLQLAEGRHGDRQLIAAPTIREMHALQFSIPVTSRPPDNIYAARFYGPGLGWFVLDYRGRKVVLHGGAWGAMTAMIPEESLGVVILSNLDLESIAGMLMYDVFDAYLVGPELAWDRTKWDATWLRNEPPGHAYRPRDEAKARLEATRQSSTSPSLPLEKYAGTYESALYGPLVVRHDRGNLTITFAEYTTTMSHWQGDAFYVRSPTRLTFDWLINFRPSSGKVDALLVKHVGWDKDEQDHLFVRNE